MLSSTSSSDERVPSAPYLRLWLIAVGLAVLLLGAWEGFWRARGFAPMPNDDVGWWARSRDAADGGQGEVVLVGSSRMQLDLDTQAFAQITGLHPIQLAIDGDTGIDVLRDLAEDQNFRGTVICELMEKYLMAIEVDPSATQAGEWLHEYRTANLFGRFEWRARAATQTAFAFRLPDLSAQNLAGHLRFRRLPPTPYVKMNLDRSKQADYYRADLPTLRAKHEAIVRDEYARMPPIKPAEFVIKAKPLAEWAAAIEARGGKVIFVRFPTSGEVRRLEDAHFPKAEYWDAMVAAYRLSAIHFADRRELREFTCPDGTHLNYDQATQFTAALAKILKEQNLVQRVQFNNEGR